MERVEGIEPSTIAWKAMVLPLNYTRIFCIGKISDQTRFFLFLHDAQNIAHRNILRLYLKQPEFI